MNVLESFIAYAADFEKTYDDDNWQRLEKYFSPQAIYRVHSKTMGCELIGPEAIFKGLKKSLDGFDRLFAKRSIAVVDDGIQTTDDTFTVDWIATYLVDDQPNLELVGRSKATYRDGVITLLEDSYTDEAEAKVEQWMLETGVLFDGSYT